MSASTKKKLRKEQTAQMTTERQKQEKKEAVKVASITAAFVIIIALVFCIFVGTITASFVAKNGLIERITTAATVGDHKLNSITMNYFFFDAVSSEYTNLQNTYGEYASSLLQYDPTKPLDEQTHSEGKTWADYYMDVAVNNAHTVYAMYDLAQADNFVLPDEYSLNIDNSVMQMQWQAAFSGFDVDGLLRATYGNGANEKTYREYLTIKAIATAYYQAHQDSLKYDADAIAAYLSEHPNDFSAYSFNSYFLNYTTYLPKDVKAEDATAEQKEAARKAAETDANELAKATTVEELDAAIAALEINKDATTAPKSTANKDVEHTTMYEEYANWLSAADRKANDINVFPSKTKDADGNETITGYYVLMFTGRNDNLEPLANVRHILINFEGGTTDSNGKTTYSDAEKATAKTKAEALLKQWKDGEATQDSFIALVKGNTGDTASAETGGLYEDIHKKANYETAFLNWSIDTSRKAGDTGIVETSYGYHIMYYVGADELSNRDYLITQELIEQDMHAWEESVLAAVTATKGKDSRINKDMILTPASN